MLLIKIICINWNMENHPRKQYNHNIIWLWSWLIKLETLACDNLTERARGDASTGYSSVLLGQLALFNGPLARYHLIRTVLWPLWLETSADCHRLGNLCKGLVASLCNHTSEVWYCAWSAHMRGWVQSSSELLRELWWKYTISAECKTDISAVLTVMSGLDPHMINKYKDGLNHFLVISCGLTEYQP